MKLSPFTLIYQSDLERSERRHVRLPGVKKGSVKPKAVGSKKSGGSKGSGRRASARGVKPRAAESTPADERLKTLRKTAPGLARSLKALPSRLSDTLLSSSFAQEALGRETNVAVEALRPVIKDLRRGDTTLTVALWDIDARVGEMPAVINLLNKCQPVFTFFDLQAPIPGGLVIQSENFAAWASQRHQRVSKKQQEEFQNNLMFNDFYKHARGVFKDIGVDYLVGITQYMVAGEEGGEFYWNYFSTSSNRIILVSAYELREYATQAGRPFEVAVAMLVVGQLLATINKKIEFHDDRGCLFDFNEDRVSLVDSIKAAQIEPGCLKLVDAKYRAAAEAMMKALRSYTRDDGSPGQPLVAAEDAAPPEENRSDSYWLKRLKSLSKELGGESK